MQTAWDFKGTSAEKHEEAIESHRKRLRENPDLAQKKLDDYSRWHKEERVPTWQERMFNKAKRDKDHKGKKVGVEELESSKTVEKNSYRNSENAGNASR